MGRILGRIAGFRHRQDGSATVEFVIWVPLIFSIILLGADVSLLFVRQNSFINTSRETARLLSRHAMDVEAAVKHAQDQAGFGSFRPDVAVEYDPGGLTVTVTVSGKASAIDPFGMLRFALGDRIGASTTYVVEPI